MANTDFNYDTDPLTGAQLPRPIPGIAHNSITGINGIVTSPGLWGPDVPNLDDVGPGLASSKLPQVFKALKRAYLPTSAAADARQAAAAQAPVDPTPDTQQPVPALPKPRLMVTATSIPDDAPQKIQDQVPTGDVAEPLREVTTGKQARSDDQPSLPTASKPTQLADRPPTDDQPNSGFTRGSNSSGLPGGGGLPGILGRAFDNIGNWRDQNRLTLLALAGGLAGSQSIGQGIGRAFQGAAAVQPQQFAMNNQNATQAYFQAHGMDPNTARAFASNKELTQEAIGQMTGLTPPKTMATQIGQGVVQWNPDTRKWEPIGGGSGNASSQAWDAMTTEQRLATLDPDTAAGVKAIGEGRAMVPNRLAALMPIAARVYPGFDQSVYNRAQKTNADFAPNGTSGKNITAIETALGHIDRMRNAADSLGNFTIAPGLNAPYNAIRGQLDPDYQRKAAAFSATAIGSSGELAKAFRAAGMSEADIQAWQKLFNPNSSPEVIKAAADEGIHMLDSRLDAIADSYNRGMPPAAQQKQASDFLSGPARAIHDRIVGGQAAPQAAPQQQLPPPPPPQQRQIGRVYNTPRGPARWMQDGWHPITGVGR